MEQCATEDGNRTYRFGDYRLVPSRQLLLRGDRPVRVGSRALELLRMLVEHPGRLLSKAELIACAWPNTHVHEDNLKVNIAALRRALGDTGSDLPIIATVPGRGYRFVATVQVEHAPPADAPAAVTSFREGGLPALSGIVGREDDIARIAEMLAWRRFLTIVGPAGVGKTTVAVAAARQAAACHPDGACFVDFAAIGDSHLVTAAIAAATGSSGTQKDILGAIVERLQGQRMLLIFDNCEHVLDAASVAADHIRGALPDIAILATSREAFRSRAETVYRLSPLSCPAADEGGDRDRAMGFAAVALFVARGREAAGFVMDDTNAAAVAAICRRLDGIPLAIELAAPRLRDCDPATLLGLLEGSFEPLSYGPAQAPIRHQTLLATLDWSYRLLSDDEAAVLRLLSVFAGIFTLEEAVGVAEGLAHPAEAIAACIESLAGKSLLSAHFADGAMQYRLLDATRSYAAGRLRGAGEMRLACAAHARFLLNLFERAEAEWHWRVREDWTAIYGHHANDLRRALDWAFGEDGDPALGIRLTACALPLWDELSSVDESSRYLRRALQSPALEASAAIVRMKLATAHAWRLSYTERFEPAAEVAWLESLRLAELTGDIDYQLRAQWGLAMLWCYGGRHRQALASLRRFEALREKASDRAAAPAGERLRVITEFYLGDVSGAHEALRQLTRRHDNADRRARIARFQIDSHVGIQTSLGFVAWISGHPREAATAAQAALEAAAGHGVSQANVLVLSVIPIAWWSGRIEAVEQHVSALAANVSRRDIAIWAPSVRFYGGLIRMARGDATAIDGVQTVLAERRASGFLIRLPSSLTMLAEAALTLGAVDVARESLGAALEVMERSEERWCRPDVLRVQGLLQRREGDMAGAERALRAAMTMAAGSGARFFELRAALALAEGWAADGRGDDARAVLSPILARFGAKDDIADLVAARRLLEPVRATPQDEARGAMAQARRTRPRVPVTFRRAAGPPG